MRKIIFILVFGLLGAKGYSQFAFPSTDSLHRYTNRFVTNSAINAFTDYRMNTLIHGIINWIDSARLGTGGSVGVDTVYALNDSTIRYRKNSVNYTFNVRGRYWKLQQVLANGSILTTNHTITLADSLTFASGKVLIENLRLTNLTEQTDTTTYKPIAIDAIGNVHKFDRWPGGISDGDKGDIVVSGNGTIFAIDNNVVTDTEIRQSAGLSVIGRSANSTGNVADITAGTDHHVFRRNGTSIGFGSINLASSDAVGSSILSIANGGTGASGFTTGSLIFKGASALSENNSNIFWDDINNRLGLGTNLPSFAFHVSKPTPGDGNGIVGMIEDSRTSGDFRIAALATRTNTMYNQLLALEGSGFSFDPFNAITGSYLRNVTADRGWYFTLNKAGTEKKAMTLTGDTTALGYNAIIDAPEFVPSGGFGGYPVLVGAQTQGSGVAVGWKAQAKNVEATAVGPQAYADGFATIAIGDAAKARTYTWGGNIDIGGTLPPSRYGNQIVIGDAAFADSNINFFVGGGAGLKNNFAICLGCAGSSTTYTLSATDRDHQGFLGWYDETSDYFDFAATGLGGQGVGMVNDWWLGGPVQATFPHDISLRVTSALGTNKSGVGWSFHGSRSTGNAPGGDFTWLGSTVGASGTALNDSIERMRLKSNGHLLLGTSTDGGEVFQVSGSVALDLGSDATGDVYYRNGSGSLVRLGIGTAGQALVVNSGATAPEWKTTSLNGSTTHDFGTLANNSSATTNITVTGAADGDFVLVTKPAASGWSNGETYAAWVSATNTVTVRQSNHSGGSAGFGSQTINVKVVKQ